VLHTPISKFILHVLSALSELERELISIRTKGGVAIVESKGFKIGKAKRLFYQN
jgi:DNA invertase Pin-like site-specific DNA recombinase